MEDKLLKKGKRRLTRKEAHATYGTPLYSSLHYYELPDGSVIDSNGEIVYETPETTRLKIAEKKLYTIIDSYFEERHRKGDTSERIKIRACQKAINTLIDNVKNNNKKESNTCTRCDGYRESDHRCL